LRRFGRLATRRTWTLTLAEGARHTKVTLNGRQTVVPRHAVDLAPETVRAILRQLGLTRSDLEV
jgi:mRNA interferase HicA